MSAQPEASRSLFQNTRFREILIVLVLGLALIAVYFAPQLSGKALKMDDIIHGEGMSREAVELVEKGEDSPLWNSRMFGGMPTFQISAIHYGDKMSWVEKPLMLFMPRPISYFWLLFAGMVFLLCVLGLHPFLAGAGGIAYAFSSYFLVAMSAGHASKIVALGYIAPLFASVLLAYQGRRWLGAALTALFLALELHANHIQITYYFVWVLAALFIGLEIRAIRNGEQKQFLITTGFLAVAALLAVGPNAARLWTTYEYQKYTMRGGAVLENTKPFGPEDVKTKEKSSGLDIGYAVQWSYGIDETMTLLIPNYKGGASQTRITAGTETYDVLAPAFGKKQAQDIVNNYPTYFGPQPGTSGPVYVGAVVCFLFVLGLFWVEGWMKWTLLAVTLLTVALSWGKNALPLTEFFFYNVPLYNKFRAVSMMLVVAEFTMPLIGFVGLWKFMEHVRTTGFSRFARISLLVSGGVLAGVLALAYITVEVPVSGADLMILGRMFGDNLPAGMLDRLVDALHDDRVSMLHMDILRSLGLVVAATGLLFAWGKGMFSNVMAAGGALIALVYVDMYFVGQRYLGEDNFVDPKKLKAIHAPTEADKSVMNDKEPGYRVLNATVSTFQDASTSYYHRSVGGYHPAKLRRYQDMVDYHFNPEMQRLMSALSTSPNADSVLATLNVLNMMNMRYLIYHPKAPALPNRHAFGPAWFVTDVAWVKSPDEEIAKVGQVNTRNTAVVHEEFRSQLASFQPGRDSAAAVRIQEFHPDNVIYQTQSSRAGLVVFSEVAYPDGWNVWVDDQPAAWFRVNYILRGMMLPAGAHKVEFRFEPKSYAEGNTVSLIGSLLIFAVVAGSIYMEFFKGKSQGADAANA